MKPRALLAVFLAFALAAPAWPQQAPAQPPAQGPAQSSAQQAEKVESKFIWGLLIQYAVSKLSAAVFDIFVQWLAPKLTGGTSGFADRILAHLVRESGASILSRGAVVPLAAAAAPAVVVGNPDKPLRVEGDQANYEGVHMALMMVEDGGRSFRFRAVDEGFRTGERFKLRVVATFSGHLTVENVNPRGERRQIYPPEPDRVVALQKSSETLLPLGPEQYFQFGGVTGREQLVIKVVDPRAAGAAASRNKVFREDTKYGSNFLQEVAAGTYPVVHQAVELTHAAR